MMLWQVYVLSKLLTEEAAFQFARENGLDIVSVVTTTVGGPFLTSSVPSSIRVLSSPITGSLLLVLSRVDYEILEFVNILTSLAETLTSVNLRRLYYAGEVEMFQILSAVKSRMGSVGVVHIEDVCNVHIFLMEHAKAEGKYLCCAESCPMSKLIQNLAKNYPRSNITR